jgi:hypothetical protein
VAKRCLDDLNEGELEAQADLLKRIRDLQDDEGLTDWEEEFLHRMEMLVLQGIDLSRGQLEKIDQIENGDEDYIPY